MAIRVRFKTGETVEYPQANYINYGGDVRDMLMIQNKSGLGTFIETIAELRADEVLEVSDVKGFPT